jgi:hypothetical protein
MREMSALWRANNKERIAQMNAEWVANNPEKVRNYKRRWKQNNKERVYADCLAWRASNPHYRVMKRIAGAAWKGKNRERVLECGRLWRSANRSSLTSQEGARRSLKMNATPAWADQFIISEIYDLADLRTCATGINWQVDHIVPLKSAIVCGLHCEANLRVVTAFENSSKGNRWWPDMPQLSSQEIEWQKEVSDTIGCSLQ